MDDPWDQSGQRRLHAKLQRDWEIAAVCEHSLATLRGRIEADRSRPRRRDRRPGRDPRES